MFFGDSSYAGRMQLVNVQGQNGLTNENKNLKIAAQEFDIQRYLSAGIYIARFEY